MSSCSMDSSDLAADVRSWRRCGPLIGAEYDEVLKIWRVTLVEDIAHGCYYFENNTEFYWKPMKLSESRSDVFKFSNIFWHFLTSQHC